MTIRTHVLAAAAAIGSLAAPAGAQYYPQQPTYPQYQQVPQPYPGRPGYGGQAYEGGGYGGQPYATRNPSHNDLSFRCNLDTRGIVTSMRVERNTTTYRRF